MCIVYQHVVLTTPVLQPPATCQKGRRTITPVGGIENREPSISYSQFLAS